MTQPQNVFSTEHEAYNVKDFTYAGETMKKGAVFPFKDLKLHETDIRGLWNAEHVRFDNTKKASTGIYKAKKPGR